MFEILIGAASLKADWFDQQVGCDGLCTLRTDECLRKGWREAVFRQNDVLVGNTGF